MKAIRTKVLAAAVAVCLSSGAYADGVRAYVGLGGGGASSSVKDQTTGSTNIYSAPAILLFGGVKFNENIAMEAEYMSAGSFKPTGVNLDVYGYGVSGVLSKPVGNWSFFGKIGLTSLTSKLSAASGYVLIVPATETKSGVSFGGGVDYAFTQNAALRLAVTSYEYSAGAGALSGRMGMFTVNGVFSF